YIFFSSRRRHTRSKRDWSSDVCSSDLNLPADVSELPENIAKVESLDLDGARQGRNDFRRPGYGGPCPPPGPAHRYFFKLYALDEIGRASCRERRMRRGGTGH